MSTASKVDRHRRPRRGTVPAGGAGGNWQQSAACLHEDPELFFPIGATGPAVVQMEEAKAVCQQCPVIADCLAWALEAGIEHGVWGGHSEEERRALRRQRSRLRASGSG
jgi:WhiB family transcriptional regulator, redox-sensing transcriptional regulator